MIDLVWLSKAIQCVKDGLADKMIKDNITVYRVKDIIRIDYKCE